MNSSWASSQFDTSVCASFRLLLKPRGMVGLRLTCLCRLDTGGTLRKVVSLPHGVALNKVVGNAGVDSIGANRFRRPSRLKREILFELLKLKGISCSSSSSQSRR